MPLDDVEPLEVETALELLVDAVEAMLAPLELEELAVEEAMLAPLDDEALLLTVAEDEEAATDAVLELEADVAAALLADVPDEPTLLSAPLELVAADEVAWELEPLELEALDAEPELTPLLPAAEAELVRAWELPLEVVAVLEAAALDAVAELPLVVAEVEPAFGFRPQRPLCVSQA